MGKENNFPEGTNFPLKKGSTRRPLRRGTEVIGGKKFSPRGKREKASPWEKISATLRKGGKKIRFKRKRKLKKASHQGRKFRVEPGGERVGSQVEGAVRFRKRVLCEIPYVKNQRRKVGERKN